MTSSAWPTELEYYLWFEGRGHDAVDMYMRDSWRHCDEWDNPPTKKDVERIFARCLDAHARIVVINTPQGARFDARNKLYGRYRLQKCLALLKSLERKFSFKLDR